MHTKVVSGSERSELQTTQKRVSGMSGNIAKGICGVCEVSLLATFPHKTLFSTFPK